MALSKASIRRAVAELRHSRSIFRRIQLLNLSAIDSRACSWTSNFSLKFE